MKLKFSIEEIVEGIRNSDRAALVRAITLIESFRPEDNQGKYQLLKLLPKKEKPSLRLGITGAPGVGKSTLIEKLGIRFLNQGLKVAILSIDPSSQVHQGSILGDKSRMLELSRNPNVFVRPSPSGAAMGGVGMYTREAILICEAFGFELIIIETVGIGQSEIAIFDLTDISLLLIQPGAGDELQAIKKGVMEWADLFVITKADGKLEALAAKSYQELLSIKPVVHELDSVSRSFVFKVSAETGAGIEDLTEEISSLWETLLRSQDLERFRGARNSRYFYREWPQMLRDKLKSDREVQAKIEKIGSQICEAGLSPEDGFNLLISFIFAGSKGSS